MFDVRHVHTCDLTPEERAAIRRLLDGAFDGQFADTDWEHTLGGIHVLVGETDTLVAHAAVVQRRLIHQDRAIRTGYVEGLAVRTDRRRRGYANIAMTVAERIIMTAYDLGALSDGANIDGFYQRRGWLTWRGATSVLSPSGMQRTADDDGAVLVLRTRTTPPLDLDQGIACDYRPGDVW